MIPGLSLQVFTVLHVVASLIGLTAGGVALVGILGSRVLPGVTALFLLATTAASVTGLLFPFARLGMGHAAGGLSLVVLAPTLVALYVHRLAGVWRRLYAAGATALVWLNALIGAQQAFAKIAYLQPLAGTPMAYLAQLALFVMFATLGVLAVWDFNPEDRSAPPQPGPQVWT